jgi:hypothetical protein
MPSSRRRGIIVDAIPLVAVDHTLADRNAEQQGDTPPDTDAEPGRGTADLGRLMDLAKRHARRLVAATHAPPSTLLLVHRGDLEVVALDGASPDTQTLPRLLAQREASLAVLMVAAQGIIAGREGRLFTIVGETADGVREEWRYRVRPCGRTWRLARLWGREAVEAAGPPVTLFEPQTATATPA